MSLNPKAATATRNASIDAAAALLNSGKLRIYDGTQPATADTAVSTQNLLATLTFNATAFASASSASAAANAITSAIAVFTSTATWFRALKSDNSTVVMDGSVGTASSNLVLDSTAIVSGGTVAVSAFTITMAA